MRKHSENFQLILLGFGIALIFAFQAIFAHLFSTAILHWLEEHLGALGAGVIARFSEVGVPLFVVIALIIGLYKYLERELSRALQDEHAALRLKLADLRTEGVALRNACETLRIGINRWIAQCMDWTERTLQTIKQIDEADAEWFKVAYATSGRTSSGTCGPAREISPRCPKWHQIRVRNQHARRIAMGEEHTDRLAGLH